jgi:hypothetical protein
VNEDDVGKYVERPARVVYVTIYDERLV